MSDPATPAPVAVVICKMFDDAYREHRPFPDEQQVMVAIDAHTAQLRQELLAQQKQPASDDGYSVKEAAAYLKRSPKTVYNWVKDGVIRASTVSRKKVLLREDVEKLYKTTATS